jgi:methylene-tetrahydromethanopterin dehydrogenase
MEKPFLLHMFTTAKNVSPFDVNMAYDAGWDAAIPYTSVNTEDITDLVQDTIFSRGPKGVRHTGIFLGGRDMDAAMDMLQAARAAMFPPFEVSVFADPSGAFTTAAAMVAAVERRLRTAHDTSLNDLSVLILGGTGPVGAAAAVLAAQSGANITILSRGLERAQRVAETLSKRYGLDSKRLEADVNDRLDHLMGTTDVVLAAAKAGIQLLDKTQLAAAARLKVAADVNAVPPSGIEGVNAQDDGAVLSESCSAAVGIGALAIGNVKYKTQQGLLLRMRESQKPQFLHFQQAFEFARDYVR